MKGERPKKLDFDFGVEPRRGDVFPVERYRRVVVELDEHPRVVAQIGRPRKLDQRRGGSETMRTSTGGIIKPINFYNPN